MLATAHNPLAAQLVGINTRFILRLCFGLAGALGAVGGDPDRADHATHYHVGIMLGLKGFVAAMLGGLGSGLGALRRRALLGIAEAMTAGLHVLGLQGRDAFVLILVILFFRPRGLFGREGHGPRMNAT